MTKILYGDHVIDEEYVQVHQEEVRAILEWLTQILAEWKSHLLVEFSKN
jgi:hypothetical protein